MSLNPPIDEPAIPPRVQRPLAAVWISLGLHAAVIALVQVAPPARHVEAHADLHGRVVAGLHAQVDRRVGLLQPPGQLSRFGAAADGSSCTRLP